MTHVGQLSDNADTLKLRRRFLLTKVSSERSNDELFGGLRKSLFCSNLGINPRVPSHLVFYRREADRERLPAFFLMTIPSLVIVILSKVQYIILREITGRFIKNIDGIMALMYVNN